MNSSKSSFTLYNNGSAYTFKTPISYINAVFKCKYPITVDATENVSFVVDYNDFINSIGGKCTVEANGLTDGILSYVVEPVAVDCVLEER